MSETKPGMSRERNEKDAKIERMLKIIFPCKACGGSGVFNDAEPGDISFRLWDCPECKGFDVEYEKDNLFQEMIKQPDTTGDQVECTDTQAEWATFQDSPTAD